ncbi:hypothetical protein CBG53_05800 [Porphyromonas gingivalis]|nr:hypothetical protein CBG53_05800 [Porphyromonas gingivalis]
MRKNFHRVFSDLLHPYSAGLYRKKVFTLFTNYKWQQISTLEAIASTLILCRVEIIVLRQKYTLANNVKRYRALETL